MRTRLPKQEKQLWKYIEKHYKEWEEEKFKAGKIKGNGI
jgi:hypothetical protein